MEYLPESSREKKSRIFTQGVFGRREKKISVAVVKRAREVKKGPGRNRAETA